MADFNYSILTNLIPMTSSAQGLYLNSAATASYLRQIIFYNVSSSNEQVQLWLVPASNVASDKYKFFNYVLSGSSTFVAEFSPPGLMITQSNASISGSTTDANGVNIMILGGTE